MEKSFSLFVFALLAQTCLSLPLSLLENRRPPEEERKFRSPVVDKEIQIISSLLKDKEISQIFVNTLPNTLDTTVESHTIGSTPLDSDSFIITGDIPALWLRDSTNQVQPYLRFSHKDDGLQALLRGLLNRQVKSVLLDAYANAFTENECSPSGPNEEDITSKPAFLGTRRNAMVSGIFERKYELDSLCSVLLFSAEYYNSTQDASPFQSAWIQAITRIFQVFRTQQQGWEEEIDPEYTFQRRATEPTDTLLHGRGHPTRRTGMIRSAFRPSDDATTFPFLVPANAMAVVALKRIADLLLIVAPQEKNLYQEALAIAIEVQLGIESHGIVQHPIHGKVFAYETDGFGNHLFMDDANLPSLLSLPWLNYIDKNDQIYRNTRSLILDQSSNPYFFSGIAGEGIGGPHIGNGYIWPMSIIMRGLTSDDDQEILMCLEMLKKSSAGTGFMHESFWKDNPSLFTRPWFAWANSLFGEFILQLVEKKPHLVLQDWITRL